MYGLFKDPQPSENAPIVELSNLLKALTTIGVAFVAVFSFILGRSRSLVPGSTRAVRTFLDSTRDPMEALTCHFNDLIRWIGQPVAVFIDDVDRCNGAYIIELLEGIQTLFRDVPVTYIVAADRRWLCTSYEKAYDTFADSIGEPGRTVGHLFLDKLFQLSTSVPRLSPTIRSAYWRGLLGIKEEDVQATFQRARLEASVRLDRLDREEAIIRLATPEVTTQTEHMLQPFADLVEPDPRAMKRMVNAYGAMRALDILKGGSVVEPKRLALWTIITLRSPILSDYLETHPELVRPVFTREPQNQNDGVPEQIRGLLLDPKVRQVIRGRGVSMALDEATIRSCLNLPPSGSQPEEAEGALEFADRVLAT